MRRPLASSCLPLNMTERCHDHLKSSVLAQDVPLENVNISGNDTDEADF